MKIFKYLLIGLLVFMIGSWLWPGEPPLYPTTGTQIVVFGDSLAAGVGASPKKDIASQLSELLGTEVLNLGVAGDTTAEGLLRIGSVLDSDPRVVIVMLGGNDAIQKVPVEETFTNLADIIKQIQSIGAAVVLVGEPGGLYGKQYEEEYERLAEEYRTFYVSNILSGLIGRNEYMSDLVHPNDKGYEMAAKRIAPVVEKAYSGGL